MSQLRYIYNKIYNNGNFTRLVTSIRNIKRLNAYYRDNFEQFDDFDAFYNNMGNLQDQLSASRAAVLEFRKQFSTNEALQPAILTECFIAQTLANILELNNFADADGGDRVPVNLANTMVSFQGITGRAFARYIYYNDAADVVILQYGDSSSIDAIFVRRRESVRIEFKEEKSRLSDPDITGFYDENGRLTPNDRFRTKYARYLPLIEIFNNETNVFAHVGHNYNLARHLTPESIREIAQGEFHNNIIEMFIFQHKDLIYPVHPGDLFDLMSFNGSEIRLSGRNTTKVFTPIYATRIINELGGEIIDNVVSLPYNIAARSRGRNRATDSKYKLNPYLHVRLDAPSVIIDEERNMIRFSFDDLLQQRPSIGLHLDVVINEQVLRNRFNTLE